MKGTMTITCRHRREAFAEYTWSKKIVTKDAKSKKAASQWDDSIDNEWGAGGNAPVEGVNVSMGASNKVKNAWSGAKSEAMTEENDWESETSKTIKLHQNQAIVLRDMITECDFGNGGGIKIVDTQQVDTIEFNDKSFDGVALSKQYMKDYWGTTEIVLTWTVQQIKKAVAQTPIEHARNKIWDGFEYKLRTHKWPDYVMYAQCNSSGNVRLWKGDHADGQEKWKAVWNDEGANSYLMFESVHWPGYYMYMQGGSSGNVRLYNGDPGQQGHFLLKEHPKHPGYWWITTKQWKDCYVYAKDSSTGNVQGWEAEPGAQGWWSISG